MNRTPEGHMIFKGYINIKEIEGQILANVYEHLGSLQEVVENMIIHNDKIKLMIHEEVKSQIAKARTIV